MDTEGATPGFTITEVVPAELVQPPTVIVTEYVPAIAEEAFVRVGFCKVDENVLGPVQLQVAPVTVGVDNDNVEKAQTGLLLLGVGVAGIALTTTNVVPAKLVHPPTAIVTEYVPAIAVVEPVLVGFCKVDEKALGPVQA